VKERAAFVEGPLMARQVGRLVALLDERLEGDAFISRLREPQPPDGPAMEPFVAGSDEPLSRLVAMWRLSAFELDLMTLALLPELDPRLGHRIAQATGKSELRLGAALDLLLGGVPLTAHVRRVLARTRLWADGLLVDDPDAGRFDKPLRVRPLLAAVLDGQIDGVIGAARFHAPELDEEMEAELRHHPGLREEVLGMVSWCRHAERVVHLPATDRREATRFARILSHDMNAALLEVEAADESAIRDGCLAAAVAGAGLLVHTTASPAVTTSLRWPSPSFVSTPLKTPFTAPGVEIRRPRVPRTGPIEQRRLWTEILGPDALGVRLDLMANQTRISPRRAAQVVRVARELAGEEPLANRHLHQALGEVLGEPDSPLSQTHRPKVAWRDLVLAPNTQRELESLVRRLQHRATIRSWGVEGPRDAGRGLVAIFHGDSGTGKTLAAEAVATQLNLPLMGVDLSRVVSKYIGETEKNLSQVFDAAEGFQAVLFFDEADALFGKRTGVKDAHDRYANVETNYMLQRLEAFEGLAILASNLPKNLDKAFARRLQFSIHFARPNAALRARLWALHLPPERRGDDVSLPALAAAFDLVGGEIRNAAVAAAYAAAALGMPHVSRGLLQEAARDTLIKQGRALPHAED
jgi:AAA+ superfamily predicted ATPase